MARDWKEYVRRHLAPLKLGQEREMQMVEEIAQHLESMYEEARAAGASDTDAFERASTHIKDWRLLECELILSKRPDAGPLITSRLRTRPSHIHSTSRERGILMGSFVQDIRYGIRMMRANKLFTAVTVISLALGIGANTAIFSLINAILLKTIPVKNPQELVLFNWIGGPRGMAHSTDGITTTDPASGLRTSTSFSYLAYERFREKSQTLSHVFAFAPIEQLNVNVESQSEIASGQLITGDYHDGLGVQIMLGRSITSEDDRQGAEPVAVISDRYWQRRFGRDSEVIGKTVSLNNAGFTIVGVTPPDFLGTLQVGEAPDISIPMSLESLIRPGSSNTGNSWSWWTRIMGRLAAGATREQVRSELEGIFQQSALEGWHAGLARAQVTGQRVSTDPRDEPNLRVESGSQGLKENRRRYSRSLTLMMIVVGLVLLIACANVANLLLSRAATRHREIALRFAMGASRWRVIRQLLTESVMLSAAGALLGLLFAYWAKGPLLTLRPWGGSEMVLDMSLDPLVLAFTTVLALMTGILFGVAPALKATSLNLVPALKTNVRGVAGASRSGLSKTLIVIQVSASIVLLIGAGLFVRTLQNIQSIDVGFNRENLLLFRVDPGLSGIRGPKALELYGRLIERIEAVSGVRAATISRHPLLSGSRRSSSIYLNGSATPEGAPEFNVVAPNFFDTMEVPVLLGRGLTVHDNASSPKVVVINEAMAKTYFGGVETAIGRRFGTAQSKDSELEIVGIVRDFKYTGPRDETKPTGYTTYLQGPGEQMNFSVRTSVNADSLANPIREAIREIEPNLPVFDVRTQLEQVDQRLAPERMFATLSSFFSMLALLLACIGLYGVMSYTVARRTSEIGIRMALGAKSGDVLRMVLSESMLLVVIGALIGLASALGLTRFIEGMLYGLTPTDPLTIALGIGVMIVVAALAGYIPARRASRVDPMTALRYE